MSEQRILCDRCHAIMNTDVSFRIESTGGQLAASHHRWPVRVDLCGACHDRITELILTLCSNPEAWVQIPGPG